MPAPLAPVVNVFSVDIPVGRKSCTVKVLNYNELQLYIENCLRKTCSLIDGSTILYVSSNVELHWEEHHFIEARFDCTKRTLHVTVNRHTVFDTVLA